MNLVLIFMAIDILPYFLTIATALVVVIGFVGWLRLKFSHKKTPKTIIRSSTFKYEDFVKSLGGFDNCLEVDFNNSRLILKLEDNSKLDIDLARQCGASGIVKTEKKITIVLGSRAEAVSKYINSHK
jgi:phosphotransferase system IIB component